MGIHSAIFLPEKWRYKSWYWPKYAGNMKNREGRQLGGQRTTLEIFVLVNIKIQKPWSQTSRNKDCRPGLQPRASFPGKSSFDKKLGIAGHHWLSQISNATSWKRQHDHTPSNREQGSIKAAVLYLYFYWDGRVIREFWLILMPAIVERFWQRLIDMMRFRGKP